MSAGARARIAASLCLALSAFSAMLAASQQGASFSSKIEVVRVDVLATDNGRPIPGLGVSDFEVLDNDVPQQVDFVSFGQIPLNVILALDMSDSVEGQRLESLRDAGQALLGGLKNDDRAALITFSERVRLGAGLTGDPSVVRTALDRAMASGNTALIDGTYAAILLGESDAGRALVIVFSDGLDTSSWLTAQSALDTAKRSDAVVYAVSVQSRVKPRVPARPDHGDRWPIVRSGEDGQSRAGLSERPRGIPPARYLVSYTPRGVATDGWHKLDVRIKNRKATIKARPGYLAGAAK